VAPGEVSGLKNAEPVMAGVLGGDYKYIAGYLILQYPDLGS